jgi:glycosyltransferase involved in cell wall biosynthesis
VKIALVLTASIGGIGRHVASIGPRLVARGHAVRLFCPPMTAAAQGFDPVLDVRPLSALAALRGADVVHAHGYKAGALTIPVTRLARSPLVVTWHNAVLGAGGTARAARLLQRVVARGAELTLGASSDLVAEATRLGARKARLAPVAAPALPAATEPRAPLRTRLGLGPRDVAVLTVARLAPQKNLDLLLDIAAGVPADARLVFLVVGEGPERSRLETRIEAERLPVRLLGQRDDVGSLLNAADIAALTSTWEARALVAQEALLAGLPLVAPRVGGLPELLGDAAVLVPPNDADAARTALLRLAADPAERDRMREAGLVHAAGWPDEDDVVDDLLTAYANLSRSQGDSAGHA